MCVVSMVYDHYGQHPQWPWNQPITPQPLPQVPIPPIVDPQTQPLIWTQPQQPAITPAQINDLTQLIEDFKKAIEAAKVVDELTDQKDCEDPEKAKLEDRVSALEEEIRQLREELAKT